MEAPELDIELGKAYEFDLSDSSLEQHPFAINLNGDRYDLNVIDDYSEVFSLSEKIITAGKLPDSSLFF